MITSRKTAAIAGLILGLTLGIIGGAWGVLEWRSRQAPIQFDYIEQI